MRRISWRPAAAWIGLAATLAAPAARAAPAGPAEVVASAGAAGLSWRPQIAHERATLVVAGRQGIVARRQFGPGEPLLFPPLDAEGRPLADGTYRWELRLVRSLPAEVAEALKAAAEAGDDRSYLAILAGIDSLVLRSSGRFRVAGGALVAAGSPASEARSERAPAAPEPLDPDTEIMDADPRLTFTDTDENDFYIEADAHVLGFFDKDAGIRILGLDAGSSADSIFVTEGSVGLFTTAPDSPDVELHVVSDGDTVPELRLDDGSDQAWDLRAALDDFQVVDDSAPLFPAVVLEIDKTILSPSAAVYELVFEGDATVNGDVSLGSSRDLKTGLEPAAAAELLASLAELPLYTWSYRSDPQAARHLGPLAEDFHALFGLGRDDKHLSPADTAGLALAAIQGLAGLLAEKDEELAELRGRLAALEKALAAVGGAGRGALIRSGRSLDIVNDPQPARGLQ